MITFPVVALEARPQRRASSFLPAAQPDAAGGDRCERLWRAPARRPANL